MRRLRKVYSSRSAILAASVNWQYQAANGYIIVYDGESRSANPFDGFFNLKTEQSRINASASDCIIRIADNLPAADSIILENESDFILRWFVSDYDPDTNSIEILVRFIDSFKRVSDKRPRSDRERATTHIRGTLDSNYIVNVADSEISNCVAFLTTYVMKHDETYSTLKNYKPSYNYDKYYDYEDEEDLELQMGEDYADALEQLVLSNIPGVVDFMDEPSTHAGVGQVVDYLTFDDGRQLQFTFDYRTQVDTLYEIGPKRTARAYFNEIKRRLKSGQYDEV